MNYPSAKSDEASMEIVRVSMGELPRRFEAVAIGCGEDLVVSVGGGSHYHVGAVATAVVSPSLKDNLRLTGSASVITVPGHKEDEIARSAALRLARALQCTVVLTAGIHIDNADPQEIAALVADFDALIEHLLAALQSRVR